MSGNCKDEMKKPAAKREPLDLEKVQAQLSTLKGKQYWRHLEELAGTAEFKEMLHREFPRQAAVWNDGVSRRNFLQMMGASMALAGLAGCTKQPPENIVPYVRQPEEIIPGKPLWFASAMPLGETTIPLIVKSDMGRPIKVEGNPDHPGGSMGTDTFAQASLWDMYDPDRSQTITELGEARSWEIFQSAFIPWLTAWKANRGAGVYFLTGAFTSPTLASQMDALLKLLPQARWHMYEAVNRDNARAGAQMAFGQAVDSQYKLENADVILSFDADFLSSPNNPNFLKNAWAFGERRKATNADRMNRLYVVESTLTPTGGKADHRLPVRASEIPQVAQAIAAKLGVGSGGTANGKYGKFVDAVAKDLAGHRGTSLVLAGETQPPEVHALCHAINQALGNAGKTVVYSDPVAVTPPGWKNNLDSISGLAADIQAGKVQTLFIIGCNPCVTAPDDLNFRHTDDPEHGDHRFKRYSILERVPLIIHLGQYQDETATISHWHINEAHFFETWGDARTADGTATIIQPLIEPLYAGKTAHELVGLFLDRPSYTPYEWVKSYWQGKQTGSDFETFWRKSVHDGFIPNTALPAKTVSAKGAPAISAKPAEGIELVFRPDYNIYDGRFANNAWLQELPRPISMITWDNAALISLNTAKKWGITLGAEEVDLIELDNNGRKLVAPVWVLPGQPDDSITMHLGYGRNQAGQSGNNHGFNTYLLRTAAAPVIATGLKPPTKANGTHNLAAVHLHHNVGEKGEGIDSRGAAEEEKRGILRSATLAEYKSNPRFAHSAEFEEPPVAFTLYHPKEHPYDSKATPHAWGMSIDLNSCIGCNACMAACQAENNIPVVGQWEVMRGREMHWIRIDNYYLGDYDNPQTSFQPVPCMQCQNAPCEVVCPVGATLHSSEGLNDMVYNRCVGTRYCSNNCPYKVRRFNFMLWSDFDSEQSKLRNNPDVTVRSRGVMEKCTYCIQRITRSRIEAEELQVQGKGDGLIPDGALSHDPTSLKTACQQSCPTDAIVFGNINDPKSRVNQWKQQPLNYGMLAELNTQPRTTYLAEVRNPNPELSEG
jgi:molybdopterin-containing oxidoreductase family iron-sulfur binding subunit